MRPQSPTLREGFKVEAVDMRLEKIRFDQLVSLLKAFDLIHFHCSANSVPQNYNSIEEVYESRTVLYTLVISYLYSLFDRRGTNICDLREESSRGSSTRELEDGKESIELAFNGLNFNKPAKTKENDKSAPSAF